jgi:hypothetical protein
MANLNPKGINLVVARSSTGVLLESKLRVSTLVPNGNTIPKVHETNFSVLLDNRDLISHQVQEFPNNSGNSSLSYFLGAKVKSYLTQAPAETDLMVVLYREDSQQQVPELKDSFWVRYYSKPKF